MLNLELLIEKCKRNDAKAQGELYKLYANKLFTLCLKYSRNKVEAEDNLQDAFLTIYKKIGQFQYKGAFEGWIKRITVNTALQRYRDKSVLNIVDESRIEDTTIEIDDDDVSLDFLLNCVQQLPDRYRLVFNLYALDDYSHKEIAELLDISVGTSKSNLSRARMILKDNVEKYKERLNSQTL